MNFIDEKLDELKDTFDYTSEELLVIRNIICEGIIASQLDRKIADDAYEWIANNY